MSVLRYPFTSILIIMILLLQSACQKVPGSIATTPASPDSFTSVPGGVSDDTIVLGMSAAFQGNSAGLGIELYRGAQAYFNAINEQGGVYGRKILIRTYNDSYDPDPAIENTINLVEKDDVFLLFNYVGTPTVTRVLPLLRLYEDRSAWLFFPFTGAEQLRVSPYDRVVFNLRASYRQEIAGLVDNLIAKGYSRFALFYQADAYGRSGWEGLLHALESHGLESVGEATYARGTGFESSFSEQVSILKASKPDVILEVGSYQACAGFIRDARDVGLDVPILNVSFVGTENLLSQLQSIGQKNGRDYTTNLIISQVVPYYLNPALPSAAEYQTLMDKYNPKPPTSLADPNYQPIRYSFVSFEGFLNAKMVVEILKRLGPNPDRAQIPSVVERLQSFDLGINTPVSFGADRHQGLDTVYFTTIKGGQIAPLADWEEWRK